MSLHAAQPPWGYERGFLGALLWEPSRIAEFAGEVAPEEIQDEFIRKAYTAILDLHSKGDPVDCILVGMAMGSHAYVQQLYDLVQPIGHSAHIRAYANGIQDTTAARVVAMELRGIPDALEKDPSSVHDETARLEARLHEIVKSRQSDSLRHVSEAAVEAQERLSFEIGSKGPDSGLRRLDALLGGLEPGALYVVGARPGVGKSAMGFQVAMHIGRQPGATVVLVSLEMDRRSVMHRLVAIETGVSLQRLHEGKVLGEERERARAAMTVIGGYGIHIDDKAERTVASLRAPLRALKRRYGLSLVVVDYLQLCRPERGSREASRAEQVGTISRALKLLARDLSVPVIAAAQLNRKAEGQVPTLADLRESGSIEADADVVILLHRTGVVVQPQGMDEVYFIVAKNRNGPTHTVSLLWDKEAVRFVNPPYQEAKFNGNE